MEKMIIPLFRFLLAAVTALGLSSCQSEWLSKLGVDDPTALFESADTQKGPGAAATQKKMVANKVEFSPDHKYFSVWTGVLSDIGPYPLTDTSVVRIEVEAYNNGVKCTRREVPTLINAVNTERDNVKALGAKFLLLVDLSLPQEQVDAQLEAVKEMLTVLDQENLYVAFMADDTVSPSRPVSDYMLQLYFQNASGKKLLYRSIQDKIQELLAGQEPWDGARQLKLIVFSDGAVYDQENQPLDSDHFKIENTLLHLVPPHQEDLGIFYVNFGKEADASDDSESENVLSSICESSGGAYFPSFNWTLLETAMLGNEIRSVASNRFDFVNPDGKVYRGDEHEVELLFYTVKDNRLIASVSACSNEGSFFKPIIVNGASLVEVILEGLGAALFLLLAIYLVFMFLVPFIRYRIFLKKYVIRYTGKKMAVGDIAVAESCYLCKAPFEEGDEVVVKCEHTMHKSCWDENEYHCPEYGRHCKHGSHFYDKNHLTDKRNAPYYLSWLIMAVCCGTLAWLAFSVYSDQVHKHILEIILPSGRLAGEMLNAHMNPLPSYGFMVAFFLTLGVSWLSFHRHVWTEYIEMFLRALAAGIISAILYLLVSLACIALRLESAAFFINLIPWTLSSFVIAYLGTHGSFIRLKRSIVLLAVGISVVSMFLWSMLYMQIGVDFRVLLLYTTLIYMVGMALAIASVAPRSEHYVLHVQGAVKSMDIALYKWFRANPNAVVSFGRSVDCSLQLSWDLQGNVAPVHAQITMQKGKLLLNALEDGVLYAGKPLKVEKTVKLRNGSVFQIGQTIFTYQEKDI